MTDAPAKRAELGRKIRDMRYQAGLRDRGKRYSQQELADRLGESKGTVSNWERGKYVDAQKVALVEATLAVPSGMPMPQDLPFEQPTVHAAMVHVRAAYDILRALNSGA